MLSKVVKAAFIFCLPINPFPREKLQFNYVVHPRYNLIFYHIVYIYLKLFNFQ